MGWIADQSKSIIVKNADGDETDVKRTSFGGPHGFEVKHQKLFWQTSKGESRVSKVTKPHLECVDDKGEVWAYYTQQRRCFSSSDKEKTMGELEIRKEGMSLVEAETMIMAMVVVWVKRGKRQMQGSLAGIGGGLVTTSMYVVQG